MWTSWVQGDRSRIKQVIVNLLDNAVKYTRVEGRVLLGCKPSMAKRDSKWKPTALASPPTRRRTLLNPFSGSIKPVPPGPKAWAWAS
jgi:hypothetical protein